MAITTERSNQVDLMLWEPSGVNRPDWPITVGVPFPKGALDNPQHISLWDGDREIAVVGQVLANWPDGSIRWLLLDFHVDVMGNQKKHLALRFGPGESCTQRAAAHLEITEQDGEITVINGDTTVCFRNGGRLPLDDLHYQQRSVLQPQAPLAAVLEDGKQYFASGDSVTVKVEQANDLRVVVRGDGKFTAADGTTCLDLTTRVYIYAGKPFLRIFHTITNREGRSVMIESLSCSLPTTLDSNQVRGFVTARGLDASIHPAVAGQVRLGIRTVPLPETLYDKKTLAGHVSQTVLEKAHGVMETAAAPNLELQAGDQAPEAIVGEDQHSPIVATGVLCGEGLQLALGCRNFYRQAPKQLKVQDNAIDLDLCWDFGDGPFELWRGTAKTHEMHILVKPGNNLDQPEDVLAYKRLMLAVHEPLAPTYGDSDWLQRTAVMGPLLPYQPRKYPWLEFMFRRIFESWMMQGDSTNRGANLLNFGDYWNPGRGGQWQNNEMDYGGGMLWYMLRTGYPKPFPFIEASIHHMIDVDTHHEAEDPLWVGGQRYHQVFHGAYTSPTLCHEWLEGPLYFYFYTGYERAKEVAVMRAEHFCAMIEAGVHRVKQLERVQGWPLVALSTMNDYFPNERYVQACESILDWLEQWKAEDGDLVYPYMWPLVEGEKGGSILGRGVITQALAHYHRMTGNERAWKLLVEAMRAAQPKLFSTEGLGTKTSLLRRNYFAPGESDFVLEPLGYLWEQTGDDEWIRLGILNFKLALIQRNPLVGTHMGAGGGAAEPYRFWPPFLYYADKSGLLEDLVIF